MGAVTFGDGVTPEWCSPRPGATRKDRSGRPELVLLDPDGQRLAFFTK